jgi:hypothetical protein
MWIADDDDQSQARPDVLDGLSVADGVSVRQPASVTGDLVGGVGPGWLDRGRCIEHP